MQQQASGLVELPPKGYQPLASFARAIGCNPDVAKRAAHYGNIPNAIRVYVPGTPVPIWWVPEQSTWRPNRRGRPSLGSDTDGGLSPGPRYTVHIPVQLDSNQSMTVTLSSTSRQWDHLRPEFRTGDTIQIPPDQFHHSKAVGDELCFSWTEGALKNVPEERDVQPGAVVIVLESPHQHEYNHDFTPLGPLQSSTARIRLRQQLPRLLREANIQNGDIVLANPIPFQTSLHRLMLPQYQSGVQTAVRDSVWKALWQADVGGTKMFQEDFAHRLLRYSPELVVNACTTPLRKLVHEALVAMAQCPVVNTSNHPLCWSAKTTFVTLSPRKTAGG